MIAMSPHNCIMSDPHSPETDPAASQRWVAGLCAQWCGTCRDYRPLFDRVAAQHPDTVFVWLDIEDESALVDELDIDTFPTVLVGEGRRLLFAGPVLPQAEMLLRLLTGLDGQRAAGAAPAFQALAAALQLRVRSARRD
jgi:thioredoxin 1